MEESKKINSYKIEDPLNKGEVIVTWIITHACQERCGYCISPSKNNELTTEFDHFAIQNKLIKDGLTKMRYIGGEPLIVKHLPKLISSAYDNGVNIRFGETAPISDVDIIATGGDPKFKFAVGKGISFETEHENVAVGLVNNYHAFKGYSYLLVSNGFGCIATVLFEGFQDLNKYFKRTLDEFQTNFELEQKYPHKFSGYGSFSNRLRKKKDQIMIGEIAGFQDLLWGFGIRNAVKSGFMASKNILDGNECKDYYKIAENYFKPKLNSSVVNRFIWEKFASNNYAIILNRIHNSKDPLNYLKSFYNFNFFQKLTYPFALFYMKTRYPNLKL